MKPIIAAEGMPTPIPLFAEVGRVEEPVDSVDEADDKPEAVTLVEGLYADEGIDVDATVVALAETLAAVFAESAEEILKNIVSSLAIVAPVTNSIIINTGETGRSLFVITIHLRDVRSQAWPSIYK